MMEAAYIKREYGCQTRPIRSRDREMFLLAVGLTSANPTTREPPLDRLGRTATYELSSVALG